MRYCRDCHKFTAGRPLFCQFCGRSYNVKLCPRGHRNPRAADACTTCGSHELSTPQAPQSGMSRIGYLFGFAILAGLCIFAAYFAYSILAAPDNILVLMKAGLALGCLLLLWMNLFRPSKHK